MATHRQRKAWSDLAPSTQKRYLSYGRKRGMSESQIRAYHAAGESMKGFRGHYSPANMPESAWKSLLRQTDVLKELLPKNVKPATIIEDMLEKGFTPREIETMLENQRLAVFARKQLKDRSVGKRNFDTRPIYAAVELFWY